MPVLFQSQVASFKIENQQRIVEWLLTVVFIEKRRIQKIDFVFCDDEFLLSLNKKYLHHQTLTDIITFDYGERDKIAASRRFEPACGRVTNVAKAVGCLPKAFTPDPISARLVGFLF